MSDLVNDLRTVFFEQEDELGRRAADEIERLRERIVVTGGNIDVDLLSALNKHKVTIDNQAAKLSEQRQRIEELDEKLAIARGALDVRRAQDELTDDDNKSLPNDHSELSEDRHTRSDIDFHFYYDDPDSMNRLDECMKASDFKSVLFQFDQWLRNEIKYGARVDEETLQETRDKFWIICGEYDVDPYEG